MPRARSDDGMFSGSLPPTRPLSGLPCLVSSSLVQSTTNTPTPMKLLKSRRARHPGRRDPHCHQPSGARGGHRQSRRPPLAQRHHGDLGDLAARHAPLHLRRDQRQGRRDGQEDRARRRRRRLQLAALRRESQAAPRAGQGRRDLRLLDLRQPQVRAARLREEQRPALLPRAV